MLELTYNWDTEDYGEARYFGHLAYEVDDIYATCERLMKGGVTINRPPRDGNMAFVRSPDQHSVELLQKGEPLPPQGTLDLDAEHREVVSGSAWTRQHFGLQTPLGSQHENAVCSSLPCRHHCTGHHCVSLLHFAAQVWPLSSAALVMPQPPAGT